MPSSTIVRRHKPTCGTDTKAWERSPVHGMELGWYYREILALANRRLVSGPTAALVSELGARVRQLHGIVYEGNPC